MSIGGSASITSLPSCLCLLALLALLITYFNFVSRNPTNYLSALIHQSSLQFKNSWKYFHRVGDFDALRLRIEQSRAFETVISSKALHNASDAREGAWSVSEFWINQEDTNVPLFYVKSIQSSRLETETLAYNTTRRQSDASTCVLYLHGGGWIFNSPKTYERVGRLIAEMSGFNVFLPNYRKAPQFPHPYPLLDVLLTLKHISQQGYKKIILMGDSAGGNESAALMHALFSPSAKHTPDEESWMQQVEVVCSILIYPALFFLPSDPNHFEAYRGDHGKYSPFIDAQSGFDMWRVFECKNDTCRGASKYSAMEFFAPLSVDYSKEVYENIPRTMIVVSDGDVLRDDGRAYFERLREATHEAQEIPLAHEETTTSNGVVTGKGLAQSTEDDETTDAQKTTPRVPAAPIPKHALLQVGHSFHGFLTSDMFPFSRKRDMIKKIVRWMEICLDDISEEFK